MRRTSSNSTTSPAICLHLTGSMSDDDADADPEGLFSETTERELEQVLLVLKIVTGLLTILGAILTAIRWLLA
jgi:hypothetical protein